MENITAHFLLSYTTREQYHLERSNVGNAILREALFPACGTLEVYRNAPEKGGPRTHCTGYTQGSASWYASAVPTLRASWMTQKRRSYLQTLCKKGAPFANWKFFHFSKNTLQKNYLLCTINTIQY